MLSLPIVDAGERTGRHASERVPFGGSCSPLGADPVRRAEPAGGKRYVPGGAIDKRETELALELLELSRERRLRNLHAPGSPCERSLVVKRDEVARSCRSSMPIQHVR
jgi:hypothetical protein